jgi:two-component system, sensor histidine kinase and response regulator
MRIVIRSEAAKALQPVKTTLPAHVLHDLRSPLTQIIGYSELLAEESADNPREDFAADLDRIRDAGHRMLALIESSFISGPASGLVVTGDLPKALPDPDVEERIVEPAVPERIAFAPGRVLVVDDDVVNRDVLSRRLIRQGHVVETASTGKIALDLMRDTTFDIVLLDIMMPDMDGCEVLQRMKTDPRLQTIPVIMISALSEVQTVVRCIEAGAEDYLAKPFNPTLLKARIGASLERKRNQDRESVLFEELQKNYGKLQELEKLRDDMRNMIVHDLRTPLTSVILGVEMLENHGELNATQREMMAIAGAGGKTLLGMINDLLDVEKMESGAATLQYDELSAETLVAGALKQVASLAEEGKTVLVSELVPGLPAFSGDENKLSRTLVNLIGNAIRFTRAGTVTIAASYDQRDRMCFSVRDTGDGIPAEAFERIFEKFGQADSRNRVGTGLGLAFCKLTVEAHGGSIHVESTPGVGSTFSFMIPRVTHA